MSSSKKRTILLYGRTNAGKTAQIGALSEHVLATTGLKTRLYTADRGGTATVQPYIDLGIIEAVELGDSNPWIWLNHATKGDVKGPDGKWTAGKNEKIGLFAFESLRAIAESLMADMARQAGLGVSIGGGANVTFDVKADDESLRVSGSNMAHFGVAQNTMTQEVWKSQKLNAPYILWTSSVSKDDAATASGKILGPDVIGKALTEEVPRWFDWTFRIDVIPAQQGKPERHVLYLGSHVDVNAGNAAGMGNLRLPLDSTKPGAIIEPADLVKAIQVLEGGGDSAKEAIKKRLGNKLS